MTDITVKGLEELRATLTEFSDRRFAAAIATALSRTAVQVRDKMRQEMVRTLDRPTPYTINSLYTVPATADRLEAKVRFKDDRAVSSGTPATYYMTPNVEGGQRRAKGLEKALRTVGVLPDGWLVVPGPGAVLDSYGNVSRGQIVQVLSQLRITIVAGSTRNMAFGKASIAAQRKAGGRYFVMKPGGKAAPGVYQREFMGSNITPVLLFVRSATYRKRFAFYDQGQSAAAPILTAEIERSVQEHIARLAKAGKK